MTRCTDVAHDRRARVQALLEDGLSVRDIEDETGIPKSTASAIRLFMFAVLSGVSRKGSTSDYRQTTSIESRKIDNLDIAQSK
jgi:hypothetical protein